MVENAWRTYVSYFNQRSRLLLSETNIWDLSGRNVRQRYSKWRNDVLKDSVGIQDTTEKHAGRKGEEKNCIPSIAFYMVIL